jgi:hypothetical protein
MNQQNLFMIKERLEEYPDKLKVYLKQCFNWNIKMKFIQLKEQNII